MANEETRQLLSQLVRDVVSVSSSRLKLMDGLNSSARGGAAETSLSEVHREATQPGTIPGEQTSQLSRELAELTRATLSQAETVGANTQAVIENSLVAASGGASKVAGIGQTLLSFLGGGLGLVQLLGRLFGGGGEESAPNLAEYALPPPVSIEAALAQSPGAGIHSVRYASDGLPRTVSAGSTVAAAPITIQVQAMDSRSFLDHSSEIAQAVREALLNSHALGDVVVEL